MSWNDLDVRHRVKLRRLPERRYTAPMASIPHEEDEMDELIKIRQMMSLRRVVVDGGRGVVMWLSWC